MSFFETNIKLKHFQLVTGNVSGSVQACAESFWAGVVRWAAATKANLSAKHPFEVHLVEQGAPKVAALNTAVGTQTAAVQKTAFAPGEQVLLTKSGQNPFASCNAPAPSPKQIQGPSPTKDKDDDLSGMPKFMRVHRWPYPPRLVSQMPPSPAPSLNLASTLSTDSFSGLSSSKSSEPVGSAHKSKKDIFSVLGASMPKSPSFGQDDALGPSTNAPPRPRARAVLPDPNDLFPFSPFVPLHAARPRPSVEKPAGPPSTGPFKPHFIDASVSASVGKPAEVIPATCLDEQPVPDVFDAPNGLRVLVHEADLLRLVVDAVAVPTDGGLGNSQGLGKLIEKAAGKRMRPMINKFREGLSGAFSK